MQSLRWGGVSITCDNDDDDDDDDDGVFMGFIEHFQRWVLFITRIGFRLVLMGNVGNGFESILGMQ